MVPGTDISPRNGPIAAGDGHALTCLGTGRFSLPLGPVSLDVHGHVGDFSCNIISAKRLVNAGYTFEHDTASKRLIAPCGTITYPYISANGLSWLLFGRTPLASLDTPPSLPPEAEHSLATAGLPP